MAQFAPPASQLAQPSLKTRRERSWARRGPRVLAQPTASLACFVRKCPRHRRAPVLSILWWLTISHGLVKRNRSMISLNTKQRSQSKAISESSCCAVGSEETSGERQTADSQVNCDRPKNPCGSKTSKAPVNTTRPTTTQSRNAKPGVLVARRETLTQARR